MPDESAGILTATEAESALAGFLKRNPASKIEAEEGSNQLRIMSPWGDTSLAIEVPRGNIERFSEALNRVYLPERYTAIWHTDTKDLEVIFTTLPLGAISDLRERRFTFRHRGKDIQCEYALASERLLTIAAHFIPLEQSSTQFRNLQWFRYITDEEAKKSFEEIGVEIGEPLCFWIRDVEWDDDAILTLISELNFYMTYYDRKSPAIMVHSPKLENIASQPIPRFRDGVGKFPSIIISREIDENLLRYWMESLSGDPGSRFLFSYRIVEYASSSYLDAAARGAVRKLLAAPNALDDIGALTESMLGILQGSKQDEPVRFEGLIREVVSPDALWRELSRNMAAFDQAITFDGGFTLEPITKDIKTDKQFGLNGLTAFSKRVRDLRNALSHGRDQRSTLPFLPTSHNRERLQPWASVMGFVAGEVLVYRDVGGGS